MPNLTKFAIKASHMTDAGLIQRFNDVRTMHTNTDEKIDLMRIIKDTLKHRGYSFKGNQHGGTFTKKR